MRIAIAALAPFAERDWRPLLLALISGFACAVGIAKIIALTMSATTAFPAPSAPRCLRRARRSTRSR
ncbi:protein of unknown function [Bradyrhizobium vignae]|uniref:Uncharacterized protein n=1 Tax=Bradyrhizobium vignae TaxID=1549949 RepID=A0A2U3Q6S3_9BRAD|nr:protein of unknown function [Bradyrhizobium vignae]